MALYNLICKELNAIIRDGESKNNIYAISRDNKIEIVFTASTKYARIRMNELMANGENFDHIRGNVEIRTITKNNLKRHVYKKFKNVSFANFRENVIEKDIYATYESVLNHYDLEMRIYY